MLRAILSLRVALTLPLTNPSKIYVTLYSLRRLVGRRGTIRGYYDALAPDAVTKLLADANHLFREQPK